LDLVAGGGPTQGEGFARSPDLEIGEDWHTYRMEVDGNTLRVFHDGRLALEAVDNRYLTGGKIGLWSLVLQW